jgi:arginine N-succinyltransferase
VFLIRRAKADDVPTLLKLARMVHFINLPPSREIIDAKASWSRQCFLMCADAEPAAREKRSAKARGPARGTSAVTPAAQSTGSPSGSATGRGAGAMSSRSDATPGALAQGLRALTGQSPLFMFVMEQLDHSGGVIGTSQIISRMGGVGAPNVALQLGRKEMFSESLQIGVTHTIATMHLDETGPTEIGGLILQPSFRGHRAKLGRFLAYVRFHFMGLHPEMFSQRVLAEMMGPISPDGHSPFWEHFARRFINMSYEDADAFCQTSKEFILKLFPHEPIYLTLIDPEARAVVGQVGEETVPAKRMLEKLGFRYHQRIDPFDGGPHLEAQTRDIELVRATRRAVFGSPVESGAALAQHGIVSTLDADGEFRAAETRFALDRQGRLVLPRDAFNAMSLEPGMPAGWTPLEAPPEHPHLPAVATAVPANGVVGASAAAKSSSKPARPAKPSKAARGAKAR